MTVGHKPDINTSARKFLVKTYGVVALKMRTIPYADKDRTESCCIHGIYTTYNNYVIEKY